MEENIWKYGEYDLDRDTLFTHLQNNLDSFLKHYNYTPEQKQQFTDSLSTIKQAIVNNTLQSKDGFGSFIHNPGVIADDDSTKNALYYLHKVASGYGKNLGKKKKKEEEEEEVIEDPKLTDFDYTKHGLSYEFNKQYNPFGNDTKYGLWKSGFADQNSLDTALANFVKTHREKILNTKYNYSNSNIDQDRYSLMLEDLEKDLRNGIQNTDKDKLRFFGFNPDSFILNPVTNPTDTTNDVVETPVTPETKEEPQKKSKYGDMPFREYLDKFDELGLETSDVYRLTGLILDVGSIINPEPFSAAGMGYASDYLNLQADEMDGINDSWWDDVLNFGLSTLGAVPLIGDLGMTGKVAKNIIKGSTGLLKLMSAPMMAYAIVQAGQNQEALTKSVMNVTKGDFTVDDLRNVYTVLQIALGVGNAARSGYSKAKAKDLDAQASEAMVVRVKNKGKTEDIAITDTKGKSTLEGLKSDPEAFSKYLRENYKDLGDIELASIKTNSGKILGFIPTEKPKTATVKTENKMVQEPGNVPSRFHRSRHYMDNTDKARTVEPLKTTGEAKPATGTTPETKPEKKKDRSKARKAAEERKKSKKKTSKPASETKPEVKPKVKPEVKPDIESEAPKPKSSIWKAWKEKFEKFMDELTDEPEMYKNGGVIKAQAGTKVYGTNFKFNEADYQTLYGNNKKAVGTFGGNDYRANSGVSYKKSATTDELNDLELYSSKYLPYTNDALGQKNRRQDLYTLFSEQLGKGRSLEDILGAYNNTVSEMYNYKRTHGNLIGQENNDNSTATFNKAHRALYRSANSDKGIYGYDDNLEHINGSTTLQRGPDRTSEDIHIDFSDFEFGQNDAFKAALGDRKLYKTKSGHYYLTSPVTKAVTETPDETPAEVVTKTQTGQVETKPKAPVVPEVPKQPAPERPNKKFFTPDKALTMLNYYRTLAHNKRQLKYADRLNALHYAPFEIETYSDPTLDLIRDANQAPAEALSTAQRMFTTDQDFNASLVREFYNDALKRKDQKLAETNAIESKNRARATETRNKNAESRYNSSMKNLENDFQVEEEIINNYANAERSNYESGTNAINQLATWLYTDREQKYASDMSSYAKKLSAYIQNNPNEYVYGWDDSLQELWDKAKTGSSLTPEEQRTISEIRSQLSLAFETEYNGKKHDKYGVTKGEWNPVFKKKGGRITKDQAQTIIAYLKESNKNYNKAIDRSVKGLYNHIKLQRKK